MWYFRFTKPWGIADKVDGEIEKTKKLGFNLGKQIGEGSEEGGQAQGWKPGSSRGKSDSLGVGGGRRPRGYVPPSLSSPFCFPSVVVQNPHPQVFLLEGRTFSIAGRN